MSFLMVFWPRFVISPLTSINMARIPHSGAVNCSKRLSVFCERGILPFHALAFDLTKLPGLLLRMPRDLDADSMTFFPPNKTNAANPTKTRFLLMTASISNDGQHTCH